MWRTPHLPFLGRYSKALRGLAEPAAAPKPGSCPFSSSTASFSTSRQYARSGGDRRASSEPASLVATTSGAPTMKVPRADHVPTTPRAQVAKPLRLLAIQERDDESPAAPERKERRAVLAARSSTAVEDDRPRWNEPGVQALDAVGDTLVEARDSSRQLHRRPPLASPTALGSAPARTPILPFSATTLAAPQSLGPSRELCANDSRRERVLPERSSLPALACAIRALASASVRRIKAKWFG